MHAAYVLGTLRIIPRTTKAEQDICFYFTITTRITCSSTLHLPASSQWPTAIHRSGLHAPPRPGGRRLLPDWDCGYRSGAARPGFGPSATSSADRSRRRRPHAAPARALVADNRQTSSKDQPPPSTETEAHGPRDRDPGGTARRTPGPRRRGRGRRATAPCGLSTGMRKGLMNEVWRS